jgi:biopolymer transport protein ExbB
MSTNFSPLIGNIVVNYFLQGGPVMWPILVALLAAIAVVLERALWWWSLYRRTRSAELQESFDAITNGDFDRALQLTDDTRDPFLRTVHDGLIHAHS